VQGAETPGSSTAGTHSLLTTAISALGASFNTSLYHLHYQKKLTYPPPLKICFCTANENITQQTLPQH
jgi:hypothetical protein